MDFLRHEHDWIAMQGLPAAEFLGPVWDEREAILRLIAAAALGAVVGFEREYSGKPAGLRTHVLICLGAALLTQISVNLARATDIPGAFRADPGRIAAQIVSGIGFLGAGTILHARGAVTGLTTAASIWVVAAIGMATGTGSYTLALATTALAVLTLRVLTRLEAKKRPPPVETRLLEIELDGAIQISQLQQILEASGLSAELLEVRKDDGVARVVFRTHGIAAARTAALRAVLGQGWVRRASVR